MLWIGVTQVFLGEPLAREAWLSRPASPSLWRALQGSVWLWAASCPICSCPPVVKCTLQKEELISPLAYFFLCLSASVCLLWAAFISPSSLLQFIALCWLLYFLNLPEMHLDFGIFRCLEPCTLLPMISLILRNSIWLQVCFARLCFFPFHH